MNIFIYGYNGNMARRYRAILDYLGHHHCGVDLIEGIETYYHTREYGDLSHYDGIIIATPTEQHMANLEECAKFGKPILCEKPVHKNIDELKAFYEANPNINLRMVDQYEYMNISEKEGQGTTYNYWNHGKDGIFWDCMNIIYWAKSGISLQQKSPIWECIINGKRLKIKKMDRAYIRMIHRWLTDRRAPETNKARVIYGHQKVQDMIDGK